MKTLPLFCLLVVLLATSGCATILRGRTQTLAIQSNPTGARCELSREGHVVGTVESTPGALVIEKTKHDLNISCKKPGFLDATSFAESGSEGATFGNILAGGLIGWGIDSASGADNKYPEVITVTLIPASAAQTASSDQPVVPRDNEISQKLATLDQLRKDKAITEAEYKRKRAALIDGL